MNKNIEMYVLYCIQLRMCREKVHFLDNYLLNWPAILPSTTIATK